MATHEALGVDLGTYIRPTCNEGANILFDNTGAEWDIILHQRGGLQWISNRQLAYDPLHFPLLLPHGELGWHAAVWYQGDTASHDTNAVSHHEYAADKWVLAAATLFLREVSTLINQMCVPPLPGKAPAD